MLTEKKRRSHPTIETMGFPANSHKKTNQLYGHANISSQLTWCQKEGVKKMIITHLGSDIVKNEKKALKVIQELAFKKNVEITIAFDGMEISID